MRKINFPLILLLLIFSVFVFMEHSAPKEIDWSPNLDRTQKSPFGTYIVYNELAQIFPDVQISENKMTYYQFFKNNQLTTENLIFIYPKFSMGDAELEKLLNHVEQGSYVFISAIDFPQMLADTLGFETSMSMQMGIARDRKDTLSLWLPNKQTFNNYLFSKSMYDRHFSELNDSGHIEILGQRFKNAANFASFPFGKGRFLIHLEPLVFGNYNFVNDNNYQYMQETLKHLPLRNTIWDSYPVFQQKRQGSIWRYILSQQSLRFGFYVAVLAIALFFIFGVKRTQRPIPIVAPFRNSTLDFVGTLSRLYLRGKNHKDIALKRFRFFADFLYDNFYIRIQITENLNISALAEKTGLHKNTLSKIVTDAKNINNAANISEEHLMQFSDLLDNAYAELKQTKKQEK